jgi:choline dehydrogenase-like flavoprotein
MHIDLGAGAPGHFDTDIAVIGAGAAGITVARSMLAAGRSVMLIESGGLDFEEATADLNVGTSVGQRYYDLDKSRLRFFGGTTAIWGGRCAELDPVDLDRRDWVAHSGWPFDHSELKRWYAAARTMLRIPGFEPAPGDVEPLLGALSPDELAIRYWTFDRRFDRFSFASNADLAADPRCTILTHATVREIVADHSGRAIDRLDVRGPNGATVTIRAHDYVLAAGGIENPRLLLASNSVMPAGLGNGHDLVGRFFMEHPHARGGRIIGSHVPLAAWRLLSAFRTRSRPGVEFAPLVTPSIFLQRRDGLLNTALTIAARPPVSGSRPLISRAYHHAKNKMAPTDSGRGLWKISRRAVRSFNRVTGPINPWMLHRTRGAELALVIRAEQSPNPDSRVSLGSDRDATGMPRAVLDWRLSGQDVDSVTGLVGAFSRELARLGVGHVEAAGWLNDPSRQWMSDGLISKHPFGGYHHIGTTRMADDPSEGVTDGYGRVHGLENLFVAGSSLFPTAGWANPTLTVIALAMRTADHIQAHSRN